MSTYRKKKSKVSASGWVSCCESSESCKFDMHPLKLPIASGTVHTRNVK